MDPRQQQPYAPQSPPGEPANRPPDGFQPTAVPVQPLPSSEYNNAPEPNTQPNDYSIDYLNQIAPATTTSKKSIFLVWAIIALSIITVAVLAFSLLAGGTSSMDKTAEVYMRMETLKKISQEQHRHLRDNQLRVHNRNFITFLTNATRDIQGPLSAAGIEKGKMPEKVQKNEATLSSKLKADFEDARLNINLDRVYTREMTFQLSVLHSMMQGVYDQTSSAELKQFLETTNTNLAPVSKSFSEFSVR